VTHVLVAHESQTIREVIRRLLAGVGWSVTAVGDGQAAVGALDPPPDALVLDVAVGGLLAYEVVEEIRRRALPTRVVLIASIYNRTGYKRRPTSLYGADDYVEQHHIPDSLVSKLARLIGPPPRPAHAPPPHAETSEGRSIRSAGEERLEPIAAAPVPVTSPEMVLRAERLAKLIVADIALYNGDAIDQAARTGDVHELDARLRIDLEEGRLLFDLRVPPEVRRLRDFISDALAELREQRRHAGEKA
jgi:CheY-like chemotaxis protein